MVHLFVGISGSSPRQELTKLDLQKLTEELFYAIPHKTQEVTKIVDNSIDIYWERRRYGESLDNVSPPAELFSKEDRGHDIESNSRRVYKKLMFELTGEMIQDIYKDEDDIEEPPWQKPKRATNKYYKGKDPPTTVDVLRGIVQRHVKDSRGLRELNRGDVKPLSKWGSRKKKDHVDYLLVQELREEEPQWVNYDDDELAVKMQLADAIFDSLLLETLGVYKDLYDKKYQHSEPS